MALIWHGKKVQAALALDIRQKILQSVMLIEANAKTLLSRKGGRTESGTAVLKPGTKTVMIDPESGKKAEKTGSYRSKPGEPPRTQTGHLMKSVGSEMHKTLPIGRAGVTKSAPYGKYLEFGTGPRTIRAKKAKILTDGKTFFGRVVKHPGIAPRPFLRPALKKSIPEIQIIMGRKLRGI